MKKMESKKLQHPRWLDGFLGPKNSKSQWLQHNLEEMNWNYRRMLKIIEDSNAESFAKKVEMYYQSRQELINLVYKCYRIHRSLATRHNHATGEPLINIPNLDLIPSQGKSSAIQSPLPLSKFPSFKQRNPPVCSVSKQLKRSVSVKDPERPKECPKLERPKEPEHPKCYFVKVPERPKESVYLKCYSESQSKDGDVDDEEELQHEWIDMSETEDMLLDMEALLEEKLELNVHSEGGLQNLQSQQRVKISTPPAPMPAVKKIIRFSLPDDEEEEEEELQHEGTDELEADLRDMIEKLYIQMEGDRVVSMLQGGILRYEDNMNDDDEEFRQVGESISSNVDKALLEQNLELQAEICRLLKDISSLEEYNEESNERCESLGEALSQAIEERIVKKKKKRKKKKEERIEAETLFASEVEQLKASIVKKNNDVEELNKIPEAVVAEKDQLKARLAMLEA